jgi:methylmalonyl-CoA/ethylmalonyl-CoA epimerase
MTVVRRLDHVAIAVRDTAAALARFQTGFGLSVIASEEIEQPHVRLTYIDCGNSMIQLVEPLDEASPIAEFLQTHGEGLHHICFGADEVPGAAAALSSTGTAPAALGSGRGRPSAFVVGDAPCGVPVEVTEFSFQEDVERVPGWISGPDHGSP